MTQFYVLAGAIGPTEIILIVVVIVLLFGGRKIPELMKGIGQGMKEFKKASQVEPEEKSTRVDIGDDKKETIK